VSVSEIYRTLWRHRIFIVVLTALVVGTAFYWTSRQPKLYTASSLVRVQQNVRNADEALGALLTGERLARTYEQIAETSTIRELVKAQLGNRVPLDAISVDAAQLSNLELLEISVTNADPKVAATIANAVPVALSRFVEKTGSFRDNITVVEPASPPGTPSSPKPKENLILALLLGIVLSAGLALIRENLSDRIEGTDELETATGHAVIAVIPNLRFQSLGALALAKSSPTRTGGDSAAKDGITIDLPERAERSRWGARA
jgi:capsular polysaccharide biosynthesis protein